MVTRLMDIPDTDTNSQTKPSRTTILICIVFLALLAASISWLNFRLHFNGFALNDYDEYCEIARNFYEGNGYSTSVLRPIAYQFFKTLPQPEVTRVPLYPFFLSVFFHLFGPNDNTVVFFNGICYVILVVLVFLVALELSESAFIGLVAALMTTFMESFLFYTLTAEPNVFYAAMFMAFFYFYLKYPKKTLLQGIFLGVLYQLRANTLFVFIGFLVALLAHNDGWKARLRTLMLLTGGFFLGLTPYMVRNYMIVGKPFFSLYKYSLLLLTKDFPGYTAWGRITNVDPIAYALSHPNEMVVKSLIQFRDLLTASVTFYKPIVLVLVGAALLFPIADSRLKFLRTAVLAGAAFQLVMLMPIGSVPYYYVLFPAHYFNNAVEYQDSPQTIHLRGAVVRTCGLCLYNHSVLGNP
jgi:hypothetical protein